MNPNPHSPASPFGSPIASPIASDTLFSDAVPGALKNLVDRYGAELLGDAQRLRGLLADEVPQARKEISVLLLALEERVPQDLLRVHSGEPISSLSPRLVRRLAEEKALAPDAARWAVQAWARGLGVDAALPLLSQPAAEAAAAPLLQPAASAAAFTAAAAANAGPAPAASPLADRRLRLAAGGAAAVIALAAAVWWFSVPQLEIAAMHTPGPLIGNGKPVPLLVDYAARNTRVSSAELRLVKGEGNWGGTNWRFDVAPDGSAGSRVAAGTLQVSTTRPLAATFELVLVGADGKRSAPFQRTFEVVPPLVITKVGVPRPLLVGQPVALDVAFQKGGAEVVRIERKVIDSSPAWPQPEQASALKLGADAAGFAYRLEPFARPTRATLELTLVDAAGQRSDPVRVALNVGSVAPPAAGTGPGEVVALRQVGSAAQGDWTTAMSTAAGAVLGFVTGRQVGKGGGRTAATVIGTAGGAWAGYEVGKRIAGGDPNGVWETTVRLDDGSTRVITTRGTPPWRIGTRVVWDGRTLSPGTAR